MQTKLRMIGMISATFVAGLLWPSILAAASNTPQAGKAPVSAKAAPKSATKAAPVTRLLKAVAAKFGSKPQHVGMASWYGQQHQGKKMANGQPFDRRKFTAATWNVPLGTVLHVVNLKNGNSVNVTVTDRGPHPRLSRAIDLSEAAAIELGYRDQGLTSVFITIVPVPKFESAEILADLIAPPADLPMDLPVPGENRREVAIAMAASLGLIR